MKFQFTKPKFEVTTKGYWHDDIIETIVIDAKSLNEAIQKWANIVEEKYYVKISKTARMKPQSMYVDMKDGSTKKIGLIFNASTEVQDDKNRKWKKITIRLWMRINKLDDIWGGQK